MSDAQPELELARAMQEMSDRFDTLCGERHKAGAAEYGEFTFLSNDVVRMMAEELADTANYCRMQFIKLMLLQELLEDSYEQRSDDEGNITIGVKSFQGTGDKGWGK